MSILPVLFSYFFISAESKKLLHDNSIAKLNDVATLQHKRIRQLLSSKKESVNLISNSTQLKVLVRQVQKIDSKISINTILNILVDAKNSSSNIEDLSIISLEQNLIVSTEREINSHHRHTFNYSKQSTENLFNIQIFKGDDDRLIVGFLERLYINDKHIGYISVEFSSQELINIISDYTGLGRTGEVVLAGRNIEGNTMFLTPTRHNENSAFNIIIPKDKLDIPITFAMQGESSILKDYVDYRAVPVLAISRHIPEMSWGMIVKIDNNEVFEQLVHLQSFILQLGLLVITFAIVISIYLSRKISEPILALQRVVLGINEGNIKLRAQSSKLTEVNKLGDSFNEMFSSQLLAEVTLHDAIKQLTDTNGQLHAEAERFQRWKESNFIGILHSDAEGNILDANSALLNMLGYSEVELHNGDIDWQHLTPKEFLHLDMEAIEEAKEKGYWTPFEKEYLHRDGRRVPILIGGSLFKYDSQEFIVFIIDLTDRNKQLDVLEKYRRIIDDSTDLIAFIDTNYKYQMVNPTYCKYHGISKKEIKNHYISDILGEDIFIEKIKPLTERVLLGEIIKDTETINFKALGKKLLNVTYTPYKNDVGNIVGFIFRGEDITELEEHRQLIESTKVEQLQIINSMLEGVLTTDNTGVVLTFNPEAENIFGYKANEIVGKNVSLLIPHHHAVQHDSYLIGFLKGNESAMVGNRQGRDVLALHKQHHEFPIRVSIAELPSNQQSKARFIANFQDLTEVERQNEIINRSLRMESLGKVIGGISHDFNNILGIITGYCSLLLDAPTTELDNRYLSVISAASERGAKLTEKLLAFNKNQSADISLLSLNEVILMNKDMIVTLLTSQISLQLELDPKLRLTCADKGLLEDLLLNMSINAMHAMPSGGKLKIKTENVILSNDDKFDMSFQAGPHVKLTIEDNGCGMGKEVSSQIFEPFYTTKGNVGHGLGLSQCYGFVKSCNGVINVDSVINKGTVFSIYLPVTVEKKITKKSPATISDGNIKFDARNYTLLIVDDENEIRSLNSEILNNAGFKVFSFDNATQALALLSDEHIDMIVTDVVMPKMGGLEFIEKAKELVPSIKYLFVSGYLDEKDSTQAEKIKPLLNKPYRGSELISVIEALIQS
ncbi:PAS domain S-box protein [Colwellia sp. 75C3]|uniref:PAS domain S-box protein n=1 Tax=Colwellia sp. 75C3 TaxID=888425 RepID=UPI0018E32773|nr:PAS domain S-box protein [Colwellia sp. 75C3]